MSNAVLWILTLHLAAMVLWIGGLFMALAAAQPGAAEPAARAERARLAQKAMRRLAHPGAALMVVTGALMMYLVPGVALATWLHAKLTLVLILIVFDLALTFRLRQMPDREPTPGQLGLFHGAIGLLFALILILAVVRPF